MMIYYTNPERNQSQTMSYQLYRNYRENLITNL